MASDACVERAEGGCPGEAPSLLPRAVTVLALDLGLRTGWARSDGGSGVFAPEHGRDHGMATSWLLSTQAGHNTPASWDEKSGPSDVCLPALQSGFAQQSLDLPTVRPFSTHVIRLCF